MDQIVAEAFSPEFFQYTASTAPMNHTLLLLVQSVTSEIAHSPISPGDIVHHGVEKVVFWAVLIVVGIAHLAHLSINLLHWPRWLVDHFEKWEHTRVSEIVNSVLAAKAAKVEEQSQQFHAKVNKAAVLPDAEAICRQLLALVYHSKPVSVGRNQPTTLPCYVDVMSGCTDAIYCGQCASVLATFIKRQPPLMEKPFDRIIGLKGGSPTLAVALAERLDMPVSLFRGRGAPKHQGLEETNAYFDGKLIVEERVLIVDDSTTGGRMMLEAVAALKEAGVNVHHALVMFEPIGKQARDKLSALGVELWSIIKMTEAEQNSLKRLASKQDQK